MRCTIPGLLDASGETSDGISPDPRKMAGRLMLIRSPASRTRPAYYKRKGELSHGTTKQS